jgi:hypothetical protein
MTYFLREYLLLIESHKLGPPKELRSNKAIARFKWNGCPHNAAVNRAVDIIECYNFVLLVYGKLRYPPISPNPYPVMHSSQRQSLHPRSIRCPHLDQRTPWPSAAAHSKMTERSQTAGCQGREGSGSGGYLDSESTLNACVTEIPRSARLIVSRFCMKDTTQVEDLA